MREARYSNGVLLDVFVLDVTEWRVGNVSALDAASRLVLIELSLSYLNVIDDAVHMSKNFYGRCGLDSEEHLGRCLDDLSQNGFVRVDGDRVEILKPVWHPSTENARNFNAPSATPEGFVYLLRSGRETGEYKIGVAKHPPTRAKAIGTKMPSQATLLHSFPCDNARKAESMLHRAAHQLGDHLNGEWFRLPDHVVTRFRSITGFQHADERTSWEIDGRWITASAVTVLSRGES